MKDRLIIEKGEAASKLNQVQNLLKLQVEIDKQNGLLLKNEIDQLKSQIDSNTCKQTQMTQRITQRNQHLLTI
jgi:hypothetical protein